MKQPKVAIIHETLQDGKTSHKVSDMSINDTFVAMDPFHNTKDLNWIPTNECKAFQPEIEKPSRFKNFLSYFSKR